MWKVKDHHRILAIVFSSTNTLRSMIMRHVLQAAVIGFIALAAPATAFAEPAQIIVLRHGEKKNGHELCDQGNRRAQALAAQFLGRGAERSLLPARGPAAILAITLHTIETIEPTAQTWSLKVKASPVPRGEKGEEKDEDLDKSTREAANDVLTNPALLGQDRDHGLGAQAHREHRAQRGIDEPAGAAAP
jgi:hypothetical protein